MFKVTAQVGKTAENTQEYSINVIARNKQQARLKYYKLMSTTNHRVFTPLKVEKVYTKKLKH